jgi:hypothetical protein
MTGGGGGCNDDGESGTDDLAIRRRWMMLHSRSCVLAGVFENEMVQAALEGEMKVGSN